MVQTFVEREVQQSGQTPGYLQVQYSPDAFGAQVGRALQGLGDSTSKLGLVVKSLDDEKKANDALKAVTAAKDELRPWLYDPSDGIFAKQGGQAIGTGGQASEVLQDIKRRHLEGITDPDTKLAFERLWLREEEQTKDQVARHELGEFGKYRVETTKGVLTSAMQDAYNQYNDEDAIAKSLDLARKAIDVNSAGLPEEAIAAAHAEAKSQIHLAVISRWANENPYKALEYYEKNKDSISGKDHVTASALVDAAQANRRSDEHVARITGRSGSARNIYSAIERAESAGDPTAVSPAGAIGVMQLMPDTAREILARTGRADLARLPEADLVKLLKERPELNRELGQTYFDQQLKAYGGDVEAALVAYNAGPKWADEFLKHNAGKVPGQRSYDVPGNKKLKSETEGYVQKVLGNLGLNPSGPPPGYRMTRENWNLRNFTPADLMAPSEGGQWVDARAAQSLDTLADVMSQRFPGFKIKVNEPHDFDTGKGTAGKRRGTSDPKDNPHVDKSQHLHGTAFDVQVQGWSDEQKAAFLAEARKLGFGGVGFYGPDGHLHIDMGNERTWGAVPDWAREAMQVQVAKGPQGQPVAGELPTTAASTFYGPGAGNAPGAFMPTDTPDLNAWLAEAQTIADPGERERAIAKLRIIAAEREAEAVRNKAAIQQQAWDTVINGSVKDLGAELLARLEPSFVNTLYTYEGHKSKGGVPQNWEIWSRVSGLEPEELLRIDPYTEYRNHLDDEHFDKLLNYVREAQKAKNGDANSSALLANVRTRSQIVDDLAIEQGWRNAKGQITGSGFKALAEFNREFDRRVLMEQRATGKELDATALQDIADKLLIEDKYRTPYTFGSFGGQGKALQTEEPESFIAADAWDAIQRDDQETIISAYNKMWKSDPDRETATDIYNRAMRVWLGARPDGPEEEQAIVRQSINNTLGRPITDAEFERYYAKYLLQFLGR